MSSAALGPGRGVWMRGFLLPMITSRENTGMFALTEQQVEILNGRHFATVATVNPDGSPEATVVWIETDGTYIYFNTAFPRLKAAISSATLASRSRFLTPSTLTTTCSPS